MMMINNKNDIIIMLCDNEIIILPILTIMIMVGHNNHNKSIACNDYSRNCPKSYLWITLQDALQS